MYVRKYVHIYTYMFATYIHTSKMDDTFLLQFRDNSSRGFDSEIFTINFSAVCRHNGVEVQGLRRSDGDHVVYRHIYKMAGPGHGRGGRGCS